MSTFQLADQETRDLLSDLLFTYAPKFPRLEDGPGLYQEIIDAHVNITVLMALGDRDEDGVLVGDAIMHQGQKALGLFKIRNLELRALGVGDCTITLDGDWWPTASLDQRRALLDHELFHLDFKRDDGGMIRRDDLGRPMLRCRPHTFEVGWFAQIAARHGQASQELIQARAAHEQFGGVFWPGLQGEFRCLQANDLDGRIDAHFDAVGRSAKAFAQMADGTTVTVSANGKKILEVKGTKQADANAEADK